MPWKGVWNAAGENEPLKAHYETLMATIDAMRKAGAEVVDTGFPSADEIIAPNGWNW